MVSIMLQGTGSDVGKSVLVAGLCRLFANRGLRAIPFKAQNMSNNAAAAQGDNFCGEIGRAQALQALACRVKANVDMNPVLLKPQSDTGAQVIVQGKVFGFLNAKDFNTKRAPLLGAALESFERLCRDSDIVVVEGAGSPAETNLRHGDIANMGFAQAAGVPVILVGDIDRGGVIASVVGTKVVLEPEDAALIRGFIINRFRGDIALFDDGYRTIEKMTGWRGLGIVPWLPAARSLPAEDAVPDDLRSAGAVVIAVPIMPHIANFDDIDALEAESAARVVRVRPGQVFPADARLVILPGSKAVISDLAFFREQGWDVDLAAHIRRGGYVLGICGGYQMLGKTIADPLGIEGVPAEVAGLGLLPVRTVLEAEKRVTEVSGVSLPERIPFRGYEIHCGRTELDEGAMPFLELEDGTLDGAVGWPPRPAAVNQAGSCQRQLHKQNCPAALRRGWAAWMPPVSKPTVFAEQKLYKQNCNAALRRGWQFCGCYVHRLFDDPRQRAAWLTMLGAKSDGIAQEARVDAALDSIAAALEERLDVEGILAIAQSGLHR